MKAPCNRAGPFASGGRPAPGSCLTFGPCITALERAGIRELKDGPAVKIQPGRDGRESAIDLQLG